jgi:hypothetical protein
VVVLNDKRHVIISRQVGAATSDERIDDATHSLHIDFKVVAIISQGWLLSQQSEARSHLLTRFNLIFVQQKDRI